MYETDFVDFVWLTFALLLTASAGDMPEQLLYDDTATIFFGEVAGYHPEGEISYIEVTTTEKVKGDVLVGINGTYQNIEPIGGFSPKAGETYLFVYLNGSGYVFETTSQNTKNIQLRGNVGDMWERFEQYLTDREYEKAEEDRIARLVAPEPIGEQMTLTEFLGVDRNDAETVNLHYRPYMIEVDADEFYNLADNIILTDIENKPMEKFDGDKVSLPRGIYVLVNGFDGYAFISNECTVDKYGMHMSRLPMADYSIKEADLQRLRTLLPEEVQKELFGKNNTKYYVVAGILALIIAIVITGLIASKKKKDRD